VSDTPDWWTALWYFYNSGAFKPAADIALLGVFAFVIPALVALPAKLTFSSQEESSNRVDFNRLRGWIYILGIATCVLSFLPSAFYLPLLRSTKGKVSEVVLPATAHCKLVGLYACTLSLLICFGIFYFLHRKALKLYSAIKV
jgi:hypothetical protein